MSVQFLMSNHAVLCSTALFCDMCSPDLGIPQEGELKVEALLTRSCRFLGHSVLGGFLPSDPQWAPRHL